ncbi:DNA sulfur modification protein DndB [Bacillus sp. FJAT-52991]|uniref:DNA sulfur modification protein DndB n=1 Tax=Bacillus kandeliae TaxID=3129297 RepID=A0ABZ2N7K5_9BACI
MGFLESATKKEEYPISISAVRGNQFGQIVYSAQTTAENILAIFEVDPSVQRELNSEQVGSLSTYILSRLLENEHTIYFPPFVFSARGHGKYVEEELMYKLTLNNRMAVLDGQHRLRALESVADRLKSSANHQDRQLYEKLIKVPLSLQIYEGLTIEKEQQLFTDINAKSTRVGANLIKYYDEDNITSKLMREVVHYHPTISVDSFELRKNQTRRKLMTGLTVYKLIVMLHSGRVISNHENYEFEVSEYEELFKKINKFLILLTKYMPSNAYKREESIYLNQSVLIGLVKVISKISPDQWDHFFSNVVVSYDWSHRNKDFHRVRIPYNRQTCRFRLSPGSKVIKTIDTILTQKAKKGGYLVV